MPLTTESSRVPPDSRPLTRKPWFTTSSFMLYSIT
jgi:hypothetical protein